MTAIKPTIWLLLTLLWPCSTAFSAPNVERTARQIDRLLAEEVHKSASQLAPQADDATFAKRVWLDTVGDIPTPEELTEFLLDPRTDKRERLVRDLLDRPQYGQNWARYWRDVILSRRLEDRALLVSNPLVVQLREKLNAGAGWDEIAAEFITASGDIRENGATAIVAAQDGQTEEITAEVSRIFLGIQIQCAQCHDHPWDDWKREQFHELAAFFPRVTFRPVQTPTRRSFEVAGNDRSPRRAMMNPDAQKRRGTAEHYMPDLDRPDLPGTRIQPKFFLTSAELPYGTPDAERRSELAGWLTQSEWFATSLVNRMWSELVGQGFYEPVDDLGPDRETPAPKTVKFLAEQFERSDYDLRWLCRVIMATETYRREVRPRPESDDVPMTANVAQPLRGDQLFNALLTATGIDEEKVGRLTTNRTRGYGGQVTPRAVFNVAFGYDPSTAREAISASIPQALALMNTPQIDRALSGRRGTALRGMLNNIRDNDQLTDELYLRCFSRLPSSSERQLVLDYVEEVGDRTQAYEDTFWMLVNSAEFMVRR